MLTKLIGQANGVRIASWVIEDGMGFWDAASWWGQRKPRVVRHNGVDLREYRTTDGGTGVLDAGARVPMLRAGRVIAVIKDYIATSIFTEVGPMDGGRLVIAYGHVEPEPGVAVGAEFAEGAVIARVAMSTRPMPSHLHISALVLPVGYDNASITWERLEGDKGVRFVELI